MIVDTDVLIRFLRGSTKAADDLDKIDSIFVSSVSYMELIQGARSKKEITLIDRSLKAVGSQIIHVDEAISQQAVTFVKTYFHARSVQLADALIAATSIQYGQPLLTANKKHFSAIEELDLHVFRP